ncbi:hypothetical protein M7I_0006 [Glarea lozoyensis 74030]|uniref:Berberine/berberine-like domain-containing protein n=1 Tax=Glarea lozoyensis (strain ATCC 74030 / MF5533) TaxID=1104152 RepID=H0EC73_GLAL7|nr:hypothetical protein M7I_0006 [Glarea lozoyensis 74030]
MDVKTGVDFARKHDIRLIVKGTGHDYLGRSSGSNSLSIWTRHMREIYSGPSAGPNVTSPEMNITEPIDAYAGIFHLPAFSPENTTESLREALTVVFEKALAAYPGEFLSLVPPPVEYSQFWEWWRDNNGPLNGGGDVIVGSRLLGKKELMTDTATLAKALKAAGAVPGLDLYLVGPGGNGPRKVVRRGGGSVVSSIWKDVLVHTGVTWPAFDKDTELRQKSLLTNKYVEALRQLAPDSHAYVNEADPNEPNFQRTFWGDNYERLLAIKRKYDPTDVLWCHPCVGNEGWKVASVL